MDRPTTNRKAGGAMIALLSAAMAVGAANAQSKLTPEQSALEAYRDMSAAERADLVSEAMANAATPTRAATANEKAMLAETPEQSRLRIKQREDLRKSASASRVGKEIRVGSAVGVVVGTAFLTSRRVVSTNDGLHFETCEPGTHKHDAKTTEALAKATREGKKGAAHE